MRIFWRSWSPLEAQFELNRIKDLPLGNKWVNAHKHQPGPGDIYLTTNGYDHKRGPFKSATWYAESYLYLRGEYDHWERNNNKWHHRFHFNPYYNNFPRCSPLGIGTWWKSELDLFESLRGNKKIDHQFGMVLGFKPANLGNSYDFRWMRAQAVKNGKGRSFRYYGTKWPGGDPNYGGEKYINGNRNTPVKFNDARRLMSNVRFVFAFENTFHKKYSVNYLTEKIWHGFLSASIPIYAGCWNVEKIIPEDIFIDARKFDLDVHKIMDHCEKMSESEYSGYLDRIDEFLHGDGQKFCCDERFLALDKRISELFG